MYAVSLKNDFLVDDVWGILESDTIGDLSSKIPTLNIKEISYSALYRIAGPNPFLFHVFNTTIHVISIYLVYALAFLLTPKKLIIRLTTLLFAIHPIETEAVTWLSGSPYSLGTLILLSTLIIFVRVENGTLSRRWIILSVILYIVSMRTLAISFILPGILLAYVVLFSKNIRKSLLLTVPYLVWLALYSTILYSQFIERVEVANPGLTDSIITYNPLIQLPTAIGTYTQLTLFPYNLSLYHPPPVFSVSKFIFYTFCTLGLLLIGVISWKRNKLIAFGLSIFIISLAPTLLPINIGWIVAERYVHFGSIGFFLAGAVFIDYALNAWKTSKRYVHYMLLGLIIVLSTLTVKRNLEWQSKDTFWPATYRHTPNSSQSLNNMGDYYNRHGDQIQALIFFERARAAQPRFGEATHNLASVYFALNEATKASELFQEAGIYKPEQYQSHRQVARIAIIHEDYKKAEIYTLKSINYNPDPFLDYILLSDIYKSEGNEDRRAHALSFARKHSNNDPVKLAILEALENR